jgi:hypothetical protein
MAEVYYCFAFRHLEKAKQDPHNPPKKITDEVRASAPASSVP